MEAAFPDLSMLQDVDEQLNTFLEGWQMGAGQEQLDRIVLSAGAGVQRGAHDPRPSAGSGTAQSSLSAERTSAHHEHETEVGDEPGTADSKANRSRQRVLEKNRRAQKRFRDKQKVKAKTMESQLEQLQDDARSLSEERDALKRQNEVLQKVLTLQQNQLATLSCSATAHGAQSTSAENQGMLQSKAGSGTIVSDAMREEFRGLKAHEATSRWQAFVEDMALLLVEVNSSVQAHASWARLTKVCKEATAFIGTLARVNPTAMEALVSQYSTTESMQTSQVSLREKVAGLQLNFEQSEQIAYLHQLMLQNTAKLHVQRQLLVKSLAADLPYTHGKQYERVRCMKAFECMGKLRTNFQTEHDSHSIFISSILTSVLTEVQVARCCTQAHPSFPDMFQLARTVALDQKQQKRLAATGTVESGMRPAKFPCVSQGAAAFGMP